MALVLDLSVALMDVSTVVGLFDAMASSEREANKLEDEWRQLQGVLEGASRIGSLGPTHVAVLKSVQVLADRTSAILRAFTQRDNERTLLMFSSAMDRDTFADLSSELGQLMRALKIALAVDSASLLQETNSEIQSLIGRTEGEQPAAQIAQTAGPPPPCSRAVEHNKAQTLAEQTVGRQAAATETVVKADELAMLKEEQRLIVLKRKVELQELRTKAGQVRSAFVNPGTSPCNTAQFTYRIAHGPGPVYVIRRFSNDSN